MVDSMEDPNGITPPETTNPPDIVGATPQPAETTVPGFTLPDWKPPEQPTTPGSVIGDILTSPFRGIEEAAHDLYGAVDFLSGDLLPDWGDSRLTNQIFGGPATTATGRVLTSLFQITAGFYTGGRVLSAVGLAGKLAGLGKAGRVATGLLQGAIADTFFVDSKENLSTVLSHAGVGGPLTDFLSIKEGDNLVERRLKNALEGIGIGGALDAVFSGLKGMRNLLHHTPIADEVKNKEAVKALIEQTQQEVQDAAVSSQKAAVPKVAPKFSDKELETVVQTAGGDLNSIRKFMLTGEADATTAKKLEDFRARASTNFVEETSNPGSYRSDPKDMAPEDRLRLILKASDLNLFNTQGSDGAIAVTRAYEQLAGEAIDASRQAGKEAATEMADKAQKFVSSTLGMTKNEEATWVSRLALSASGDANAVRAVQAKLLGYNALVLDLGDRLTKVLGDAGDFTKLSDQALAEIVGQVNQTGDFIREVKGLRSESGRLLAVNKIKVKAFGDALASDATGATRAELDAANKSAQQVLTDHGGRDQIISLLQKHRDALLKDPANIANLAIHKSGRAFDVITEYWINALLSGVPTHMANITGNTVTSLYRPLETAAGAMIMRATGQAGGDSAFRSSISAFGKTISGFLDTINLFGARGEGSAIREEVAKAMRTGDPQLLGSFDLSMAANKLEFSPAITADNMSRIPILDGLSHAISGISKPTANAIGRGVDAVGNLIRTPTRALNAMDEVFKQVTYRAHAKSILEETARAKGLIGEDAARFVADGYNELIREGEALSRHRIFQDAVGEARAKLSPADLHDPEKAGQFVNDYMQQYAGPKKYLMDISNRAADVAREVTFTTPPDKSAIGRLISATQSLTRALPIMRLAIPYVQTPLNILKFASDRSGLSAAHGILEYFSNKFGGGQVTAELAHSRLMRDILSGDPLRKADAIGRVTFGAGFLATAYSLASNSMDPKSTIAISGHGPADPDERRALEKTGWQQYSIKAGDKWIQYSRLDPFASIFGTIADLTTYAHFNEDQKQIDGFSGAILTALANNLTNKTYMQGLNDSLVVLTGKEPRKVEAVMRNYAGSLVPNLLNRFTVASSDDGGVLRETRTMLDAMMARTPWGAPKLDPKRDFFGQPMSKMPTWGSDQFGRWMAFWSPYTASTESNDPVDKEMARLKHPFSGVGDSIDVGGMNVDLKNFKGPNGMTAADHYAQLVGTLQDRQGRTLRDAVHAQINSDAYRKLPDFSTEDGLPSPKVQDIMRVRSAYASAAKARVINDVPEIKQYIMDLAAKRKAAFAGAANGAPK